jgi:hypothetical protein
MYQPRSSLEVIVAENSVVGLYERGVNSSLELLIIGLPVRT